MIRTVKFALCRNPANSQTIGYYATQQNAAYNHAVDVLNREPELPKRSGRNHPDAMNKRITAWRQMDRQKADAPYHIHQQGSEQAWEANQRLQQSRTERLERVRTGHRQRGGSQAPRHPFPSAYPVTPFPQARPTQHDHHGPKAFRDRRRLPNPHQPPVQILTTATHSSDPELAGYPINPAGSSE